MIDCTGRPLRVGDRVAFVPSNPNHGEQRHGRVVEFCERTGTAHPTFWVRVQVEGTRPGLAPVARLPRTLRKVVA